MWLLIVKIMSDADLREDQHPRSLSTHVACLFDEGSDSKIGLLALDILAVGQTTGKAFPGNAYQLHIAHDLNQVY